MEVSLFNMKFRLEILVLIVIVFWLLWGNVLCSCSHVNLMETMTNYVQNQMNKNIYGYVSNGRGIPSREGMAAYSQMHNDAPNTKSWFNQASVQNYNIRTKNVKPGTVSLPTKNLPSGELLMFANTEFKPSCCPNVYSNSSGCACMSSSQSNYLLQRGNNNVPYSSY